MEPIQVPSRETLQAVYAQGEAAVIALFEGQARQIRALEGRVQALEDQLAKHSGNSSQPPSSDGLKKPQPKSERQASGKRSGGQKGHVGHRLAPVAQPDKTEIHTLAVCEHCHTPLMAVAVERMETRQVFELPEVRLEVTEHQAEVKRCPQCGRENQAAFPPEVTHPTQYGPRFRAQLVYFHSGQFIPLARTVELVEGLYQQPVSEATIVAAVAEAAQQVAAVNEALKTYLVTTAEAVQCDETGARVEGRLHWLHSAGTTQATLYTIHPKRGSVGMDAMGILKARTGWCVHDGWKPYFKYEVRHALCNAHHLRELTFIAEQYDQQWALDMRHELGQIKMAVEAARAEGRTALSLEQLAWFNHRYTVWLNAAEDEIGLPTNPPQKNNPPANLLNRLRAGRDQVLAFMTDFNVPFDNNLAERDVRMVKVQQKVSGGFRALAGARAFCAVRSYLATARKNGQSALTVLSQALTGTPYFPPCISPPTPV